MSVYAFWKCVLAAFALAWAVPVGIVLAADLFGEGGAWRRRRPLPPPSGEELEAARRVRAARGVRQAANRRKGTK